MVFLGPAVYSNPSMYFFPDVGRAEGMEILKVQLQWHWTWNNSWRDQHISRSIPTENEGYYGFTMGDDNYHRNHTYYGGVMGNLSYVVELSNVATDGYKEIDRKW